VDQEHEKKKKEDASRVSPVQYRRSEGMKKPFYTAHRKERKKKGMEKRRRYKHIITWNAEKGIRTA